MDIDQQAKEKILWLRELLKKNAPIIYSKYASYKLIKEHGSKQTTIESK